MITDFCASISMTFSNADYESRADKTIIKNVHYKGFTIAQLIISDERRIELLDIRKGRLKVAYIKAETSDLSGLFAAIHQLGADIKGGLTEERYMAEEETMCEGDYVEGENDGCVDGELIKYEVHNKAWSLNLTKLLETAQGMGFSHLSIGGISSDTFSLDALELNKLDMQSWLTDISVKGLKYKPQRDTLFRHQFKSVDFQLNSVTLERVDFISFVHFLAEAMQEQAYITYRGSRWYSIYPEEFAGYFLYAPFTARAIKNFDATLVEDGVSLRVYNANSSGAMVRGEAITDSKLQFNIKVQTQPESFESKALNIKVSQRRKPNTADKDNPLYERGYDNLTLLDESIKIDAAKHFNINLDATYAAFQKNSAALGNGFSNISKSFNLEGLLFVNKLLGYTSYGNYTINLTLDNFTPVLEQAPQLKELSITKARFGYKDAGMDAAIIDEYLKTASWNSGHQIKISED
jgi:hypothetical protein